jgi:sulfur relay (sulfurtransferase) complex TusBCD TusD component (DsrE family)
MIPETDVLLVVMGAPHESDLITSALRLTQALLEQGAVVSVWACGYATLLTQQSMGTRKPRNLAAWSVRYPSTVTLVMDLMTAFPGRLHWFGCRYCSDDRGATDHVPEVRTGTPAHFPKHVTASKQTIFMGVM